MDVTAQLEAGEAAFGAGDAEGAKILFEAALALDPGNLRALNNLGALAWNAGAADEAIAAFGQAAERGDHSATVNLAAALDTQGRLREALPAITLQLAKNHLDAGLTDLLLRIATEPFQGRRKRIAIFVWKLGETFITPLAKVLSDVYDVQFLVLTDGQQVKDPSTWADIILIEWGGPLAEWYTKNVTLPPGKKVIVRVHSYEAVDRFTAKVNWSAVEKIIYVAPHIRRISREQTPAMAEVPGSYLVPNGIDLSTFKFVDRPRGKRIAWLCRVDHKKGPMLLLHAFHALLQVDPEFELHIGGSYRDQRYALYFDEMSRALGIRESIIDHGWITDVPAFLQDKHFIACTSVLEGHPVGMCEGMARGLKPLIHTFVGATEVFPPELLWRTLPEFVARATEADYSPKAYRGVIENHFSLERQITALIAAIEADPKTMPWADFGLFPEPDPKQVPTP